MSSPVVIFGRGYTGHRVAEHLRARGITVIATTRHPDECSLYFDTFVAPKDVTFVPPGAKILYSIPPLEGADTSKIVFQALATRQPSRVVYLSTTGVYGNQLDVNEASTPAPRRPSDHARLAAEAAVLAGPWSGIVLRPAAIYGPGRGIHVSMREGRFRMAGDGSNYVSRIHVDDLAAHCEAALASSLTGAWPVADDHPCTTREIAAYCSRLLGVPMPPGTDASTLHHTRQANRRVDGRAVRQALGITLRYPGYETGIPASDPQGSSR
jgi:nucleoside-diphosphate-sugar epimerase